MDLGGLGWIGIDLSGLGDLSSLSRWPWTHCPKGYQTSSFKPLNDTLRGFAARQASKRHLPKALGLPGVSKRHLPKGLSLTRGWAVPSLF